MNCPARHHELAFSLMMNRARIFSRRVNPCVNDFQDKEVVFGDQLPVRHLAFQIGIALGDERGLDAFGGYGCKTKHLELVHAAARRVPAADHRCRQQWQADRKEG